MDHASAAAEKARPELEEFKADKRKFQDYCRNLLAGDSEQQVSSGSPGGHGLEAVGGRPPSPRSMSLLLLLFFEPESDSSE